MGIQAGIPAKSVQFFPLFPGQNPLVGYADIHFSHMAVIFGRWLALLNSNRSYIGDDGSAPFVLPR